MTDREFLKNLYKKYYKIEYTQTETCPNSSWSYGNYDDVFNDGIALGEHYIAEEIKKYIDQKELDEAIERHVIKSAEIVKNIPIENRTILHPNETKDNNNV